MKYCVYCGAQIKDDASFCTKCGKPQKKAAAPQQQEQPVAPQQQEQPAAPPPPRQTVHADYRPVAPPPKKSNAALIVIIILLAVIVAALGVLLLGKDRHTTNISINNNEPVVSDEVATPAVEAKDPYLDVLSAYESDILSYGAEQVDRHRNPGLYKNVALFDLNGDGKDELFFGAGSMGCADVHIFTKDNFGDAREVYCNGNNQLLSFYRAGAACNGDYVIIKSKVTGEFYVVTYLWDPSGSVYNLYQYYMDINGNIRLVQHVQDKLAYGSNQAVISDVYYINDHAVDKATGEACFKALKNNFSACIMWDGYIEDLSVQTLFNEGDELADSYEAAFVRLDK